MMSTFLSSLPATNWSSSEAARSAIVSTGATKLLKPTSHGVQQALGVEGVDIALDADVRVALLNNNLVVACLIMVLVLL